MSFELDNQRSLGKQVRKVALKQLSHALSEFRLKPHSPGVRDASVHTARKRIKEVRALLRLVRNGVGEKQFDRENRALRDAARPLSEVRDGAALLDALRALEERYSGEIKKGAFKPLREALQKRRRSLRRRILQKGDAVRKSATAVKAVRDRAAQWDLKSGAWKVLQAGLRRAYKKGHAAMTGALKDPSDEKLHEWRKRVKDLRYQLELLEPVWPDVMKATAEQANALSDLLGDDHDLAVLRELLGGELKDVLSKEASETLLALIDRRRTDLQRSSASLSEKLFAESPKQFEGRLKVYWKAAA